LAADSLALTFQQRADGPRPYRWLHPKDENGEKEAKKGTDLFLCSKADDADRIRAASPLDL
jgi:hypothetical protein